MIELLIAILLFVFIVSIFMPLDSIINKRRFSKHMKVLNRRQLDVNQHIYKFKAFIVMAEKIYRAFGVNVNLQKRKKIQDKIMRANLHSKLTVESFYGIKIFLVIALFMYFSFIYLLMGMGFILFFAVIGMALAFITPNAFLDGHIKKRQWKMIVELPTVINTLAVITDAGLSFNEAIKMLCDLRKGVLINEFNRYFEEVNMGFLQEDALFRMAERCHINEISIFVSTLAQSMEKGSSGITAVLKEQAKEMWESRLGHAKELGEKASMKLFLPMMMLVFPCMLIFVIGPAIFTLLNNFK